MSWLKKSSNLSVKIGPFVSDTDGKTPETALVINQADVLLSKNGGALTQKSEISSCTHDQNGMYDCLLNSTDTGTLGRLELYVYMAGALYVYHSYMIVVPNTFESFFGTERLEVNAVEVALPNGTGAVEILYVVEELDGDPIPDVDVWVSANADGLLVAARGRTNASGEVTFWLDPGTYYAWRQKNGWDFVNPTTFTVTV